MGINLVSPAGVPWSADYVSVTADPITDLTTDMSAEQRARSGYEHLIQLTDDEDVRKVLAFLREREVVHFQRFGELLVDIQDHTLMTVISLWIKNNQLNYFNCLS